MMTFNSDVGETVTPAAHSPRMTVNLKSVLADIAPCDTPTGMSQGNLIRNLSGNLNRDFFARDLVSRDMTPAVLSGLSKKMSSSRIFAFSDSYSYCSSRVSEEEQNESCSIVSDADGSLYADSAQNDNAMQFDRHEEVVSTLQSIRTVIPSLFKSNDTHTILAQYFSNELFFAESLANLHENFHESLIKASASQSSTEKLHEIDDELNTLTSIIEEFNRNTSVLCARYNKVDICLYSLKKVKEELNSLIHKYLGEDLNKAIDTIVDLLFEYNMIVEQEEETSVPDEASSLYNKVVASLTLSSDRLNEEKVSNFRLLVHDTFVDNESHHKYIAELLSIVNS